MDYNVDVAEPRSLIVHWFQVLIVQLAEKRYPEEERFLCKPRFSSITDFTLFISKSL